MTPRQKLMILATQEWLRPLMAIDADQEMMRLIKHNWPSRTQNGRAISQQVFTFVQVTGSRFNQIGNLAQFDKMVFELSDDCRHLGIARDDYDAICGICLWSLRRRLGNAYTAELRNAWIKLFGRIGYELSAPSDHRRAAGA
jgi:hypothetical protein